MQVADVMTTDVVRVTPETTLKAAARLLARHGVSGLPVVDADGVVLGVLSEADILVKEAVPDRTRRGLLHWLLEPADPALREKLEAETVAEAMTRPALVVTGERSVRDAAAIMLTDGVNRLPVVDDDHHLVGIVTRADLVRAFTRGDEEIRHEIEQDVLQRTMWLEPDTVSVKVEGGHVTLQGEVETEPETELLERFVQRVPGVVSVESTVSYRVAEKALK